MRYVIFDDALDGNELGWTADEFAEAVRAPLSAIGVRVIRQHCCGHAQTGGFRAIGYRPRKIKSTREKVERIVSHALSARPPRTCAARTSYDHPP